jgi:hypothetical protein
LLDLKDLQALLVWIEEQAKELSLRFGNVSISSINEIHCRLLVLENQVGNSLLGEPASELSDIIRTETDGRGVINLLAADQLMKSPWLYAPFLFWLLSELFEELQKVDKPDKP